MTVRQAELVMALATCAVSLALMWSSSDGLAIGWVSGKGPGSGFWPFWLSTGLLLVSIWTLIRWFLRQTPESRSTEPYMTSHSVAVVGTAVGALIGLLAGIHTLGIYISLVIFMLFYAKIVGHHGWPLTIMLAGGIPLFIFALFEWLLQIPLPKAMSETWFYPVYDLMYGKTPFWPFIVGSFVVLGVIAYLVHLLSGNSSKPAGHGG